MTKEVGFDRSHVWTAEAIREHMGLVSDGDGVPVGYWTTGSRGSTVPGSRKRRKCVLTHKEAILEAGEITFEFIPEGITGRPGTIPLAGVLAARRDGVFTTVLEAVKTENAAQRIASEVGSRKSDLFLFGSFAADGICRNKVAASLGKIRRDSVPDDFFRQFVRLARMATPDRQVRVAEAMIARPDAEADEILSLMLDEYEGARALAREAGIGERAMLVTAMTLGRYGHDFGKARSAWRRIPANKLGKVSGTRKARLLANAVLSKGKGILFAADRLLARSSFDDPGWYLERLLRYSGRSQAEFSMFSKWLSFLRSAPLPPCMGSLRDIADALASPAIVRRRLAARYVRRKSLDKKKLALARAMVITGVPVDSDILARLPFDPDKSAGLTNVWSSLVRADMDISRLAPCGRRIPLSAAKYLDLSRDETPDMDDDLVLALPSPFMGTAGKLNMFVAPLVKAGVEAIGKEAVLANFAGYKAGPAGKAARRFFHVSGHATPSRLGPNAEGKSDMFRHRLAMAVFGPRFVQLAAVAPRLSHLAWRRAMRGKPDIVLAVLDGVPLKEVCAIAGMDPKVARSRTQSNGVPSTWVDRLPYPETLASQAFIHEAFHYLGTRLRTPEPVKTMVAEWLAKRLDQFGVETEAPGLSAFKDIVDFAEACAIKDDALEKGRELTPADKAFFVRKGFSPDLSVSGALKRARRWERDVADNLVPKGLDDPLPSSWLVLDGETVPEGMGFVHLDTPRKLSVEGKVMRHCVGGYADRAANDLCCLFHVSFGNEEATLDLRSGGDGIKINQLRTHRNGDVSPRLRSMVENVVIKSERKKQRLEAA